jgi:hypothetical protein
MESRVERENTPQPLDSKKYYHKPCTNGPSARPFLIESGLALEAAAKRRKITIMPYTPFEEEVEQAMAAPVEQVAKSSYCVEPESAALIGNQLQEMEGRPEGQTLEQILEQISRRQLVKNHQVQLEHSDPRHRMGRLLDAAFSVYKTRKPHGQTLYEWLDAMPEWECIAMLSHAMKDADVVCLGSVAENRLVKKNPALLEQRNLKPSIVKSFKKGVAYLDAASRPSYHVEFKGGVAHYRGALLDTSGMSTVFSGRGFGIWVMDPDGNMYVANHVLGQMHHSSFLSGGEIKAGGELRVKRGQIEFLSGKSGHYKPGMENLVGALSLLRMKGIPVAQIRVLVWNGRARLVAGSDLISKPQSYECWGFLSDDQKRQLQQGNYASFN